MNTQEAYNQWAASYDTAENKTRDLELQAAKTLLAHADFSSVLEIGCGTGKNTAWIAEKAGKIVAVDFSVEMVDIARKKISSPCVTFQMKDITQPWEYAPASLIICSLVLEHIEDIEFIFKQAEKNLAEGGMFYLCELHPFKQMEGSKARFEKEEKMVLLDSFQHHISDYLDAAKAANLHCENMHEWFDGNDRRSTPRLISFLFRANA